MFKDLFLIGGVGAAFFFSVGGISLGIGDGAHKINFANVCMSAFGDINTSEDRNTCTIEGKTYVFEEAKDKEALYDRMEKHRTADLVSVCDASGGVMVDSEYIRSENNQVCEINGSQITSKAGVLSVAGSDGTNIVEAPVEETKDNETINRFKPSNSNN